MDVSYLWTTLSSTYKTFLWLHFSPCFSDYSQADCRVFYKRCFICYSSTRFEHTPLATPNGDILIKDLSFEVLFVFLIYRRVYILHKCDLISLYYINCLIVYRGERTSRDEYTSEAQNCCSLSAS